MKPLKAATAILELLNIVCIGIAKGFGPVEAVASVLSQRSTALVRLGPVVGFAVRAHAFVRVVATGDSEGGEVEE